MINGKIMAAIRMKKWLDEKDLKVLSILQANGRETYSNIARQLNVTEAAVYTRVNRLLKAGYIKGFTAILDESKLNIGICAFVGVKVNPAKYEQVLEQLASFPEVLEVHDVTGEFYALLKVKTVSKEALSGLLDKIGRLDGVSESDTRIVLKTVKETTELPLQLLAKEKKRG